MLNQLAIISVLVATVVAADTTTEIYVPALEPGTEIPTLKGSIVTKNDKATTVALACLASATLSACDFYNSLTITYGPSTAGWIFSSPPSDGHHTDGDVETMDCSLVGSDASCTWDVTEALSAKEYTSTKTFVYSKYTDKTIEVTITAS